jgi:hypothetical protein
MVPRTPFGHSAKRAGVENEPLPAWCRGETWNPVVVYSPFLVQRSFASAGGRGWCGAGGDASVGAAVPANLTFRMRWISKSAGLLEHEF